VVARDEHYEDLQTATVDILESLIESIKSGELYIADISPEYHRPVKYVDDGSGFLYARPTPHEPVTLYFTGKFLKGRSYAENKKAEEVQHRTPPGPVFHPGSRSQGCYEPEGGGTEDGEDRTV